MIVQYQDGCLAVDIPNQVNLALYDPDDSGQWVDEFNKNAVSFIKNEDGNVNAMVLYAILKLWRLVNQ